MHSNHRGAAPAGAGTFGAKKAKNTERTWEVPVESIKPEKTEPRNHPQIPPKHAPIDPIKAQFPAPNPSLEIARQACREKTNRPERSRVNTSLTSRRNTLIQHAISQTGRTQNQSLSTACRRQSRLASRSNPVSCPTFCLPPVKLV
jgi:hypothetical protein